MQPQQLQRVRKVRTVAEQTEEQLRDARNAWVHDALHAAAVALQLFQRVLMLQADWLVEAAGVNPKLRQTVGRLWALVLSSWRRHGWGARTGDIAVTLVSSRAIHVRLMAVAQKHTRSTCTFLRGSHVESHSTVSRV